VEEVELSEVEVVAEVLVVLVAVSVWCREVAFCGEATPPEGM